jgi:tripartite-type tricarboxylate transporter receptor subunit TctC
MSSGKLRVLAVTGKQRLPSLPNVPTTAEAGYPA